MEGKGEKLDMQMSEKEKKGKGKEKYICIENAFFCWPEGFLEG